MLIIYLMRDYIQKTHLRNESVCNVFMCKTDY